MLENRIRIKLFERLLDNDTGVKIAVDDNTTTSNYHCHEFIEVCYCLEGAGTQIIDGEEIPISAGDIFLFNQDVYHCLGGVEKIRFINIMFRTSLFTEKFSKNFIKDFFGNIFSREKSNLFKQLKYLYICGRKSNVNYGVQCLNMLNEYKYIQPDYIQILYKEIELLLLNIGRDCIVKNKLFGFTKENEKAIQQVIDKINQDVTIIYTSEDVLKDVSYNAAYFNRIFERYMGITLSKYIKKKKIDYACTLLMETDLTVECISEKIGYSDVKNFYRVFKECTNQTPGAFRANVKHQK